MLKLYQFRERLETATGKKSVMDILEAYHFFIKQGKGPDCAYAKQCVSMFKREMFHDVKKEISVILDLIQKAEESNGG